MIYSGWSVSLNPDTQGYARVSTADQDEALQLRALDKAGVTAVYTDHGVSGSTTSRPRLDELLAELRAGDVFVVYSLSRLGHLRQTCSVCSPSWTSARCRFGA